MPTLSAIFCLVSLSLFQASALHQKSYASVGPGAEITTSSYTNATNWLELSRASVDVIPGPAKMRGEAPNRTGEEWTLFSGAAPGEVPNTIGPEEFHNSLDNPIAARCAPGCQSKFFFNVTTPFVSAFLVPAEDERQRTDAAVLVVPGGGFDFVAWEKEGAEIAVWLNSLGITAFVLKYRVPIRQGQEQTHLAAVQDAQRAMSLIRYHAAELGVNKSRIGTIGFSAGGQLAVMLSDSRTRLYPVVDDADKESFLPNFQMLIYGLAPIEDFINPDSHEPPPPATFLASAQDDPCVPPEVVVATAGMLEREGALVDLHMYPSGGHGYGDCAMYTTSGDWSAVCEWTQRAEEFINEVVFQRAPPSLISRQVRTLEERGDDSQNIPRDVKKAVSEDAAKQHTAGEEQELGHRKATQRL